MRTAVTAIGLCLAIGCGGESDSAPPEAVDLHPEITVPGQEGRIDGSVWLDGMFNSPEAKDEFCMGEHADLAWFCSDIGQTAAAWSSAEYHGIDTAHNTSCYGPASGNGSCRFPSQKKFRVKMTTGGCFLGAAPPAGPSTLQEQNMIDSMKAGAKAWNGLGGVIVVDDGSSGSTSYQKIALSCAECAVGGEACVGEGGLALSATTVVNNLPIGPHGKDEGKAQTNPESFMRMNTSGAWTDLVGKCGSGGVSNAEIVGRMTMVGMHEAGHALGFSHFTSGDMHNNIMNPFTPNDCSSAVTISTVFVNALTAFNPTGSVASIQDVDLETKTPD